MLYLFVKFKNSSGIKLAVLFFLAACSANTAQSNGPLDSSCSVETEERIVRGHSLDPVVNEGQTVRVLQNYYACHPVERGDIIAYRYATNSAPLIKVVKAVEGDVFSLQSNPKGQGWHLLINNEVARNSEGIPYTIDEHGYQMLMLYVRSYQGRIPARACLLLGNQPDGSLDSTHFGLVSQDDLIGKVMLR